jgi:DNA-directed RNA polymerases I, II, and III subunit RPABC1
MNNSLVNLFIIRNNAIDMLIERNYNKEFLLGNHRNIHFSEFQQLYKDNSLNIKVQHNIKPEIAILYFYNYKDKLKKEDINAIIEEIKLEIEPNLQYNLVLIIKEKPHSLIIKRIQAINNSNEENINLNIQLFYYKELIFNIIKHERVPKHILLTDTEKAELLDTYKISDKKLPQYSINDPVVKYYGVKHGDVFKIIRDSKTAGTAITYRIVNKKIEVK